MDRRTALFLAMCEADVSGDAARAESIAREAATLERASDAEARNRANLGPRTARERNAAKVGRARGPLGEAT